MENHPHITALQDRVPFFQKIVYGLGALTNNLLSGAVGVMSIVLNLGLGMNPAAVGILMACSRLTDAFLDPIMGYISDHTRTPWGRRRPYIVVGALLSGLVFALMWQIPAGHSQRFYFWFFLVGSTLFYMAFTVYAAPFIALGYEMTPDYVERIQVQGYSNLIGQIPWLLLSWFYAFMADKRYFQTPVEGARALAILVGGTVCILGVLPGIFCREPFYGVVLTVEKTKKDGDPFFTGLRRHVAEFFNGFGITLKNLRFLKLVGATFLVFNGFTMISGLGSYVIIFYVCGGDQAEGAKYVGIFGTTLSVCTLGAIFIVTWLATTIGKKQAFIVSTLIAIAGYVLKWFCYRPGSPGLLLWPAPLIAFGLGGLFTTVLAMIADVCDLDELENGHRREGMFGAIYWWTVKLGMAAALAIAGYLLNMTGFLQELGAHQPARTLLLMRVFEIGLPIAAYVLAIAAIATYDLDLAKVQTIRRDLEKRRGKVAA